MRPPARSRSSARAPRLTSPPRRTPSATNSPFPDPPASSGPPKEAGRSFFARREAFVDGLDLLRMDERLADEAEETAPAGVAAQTILIGEVGPNAVDRDAA